MSFFSTRSGVLGIDIGAGSMKLVQVQREGDRPRLVTYGCLDYDLSRVGKEDPREFPERLGGMVKVLCAHAKTTTKRVIAALPTFSVFSALLRLPVTEKKKLGEAVQWEAKKVIPLPIEEMILDWKVLQEEKEAARGGEETSGALGRKSSVITTEARQGMRVLLTAAAKKLVKQYMDIFRASGLELVSLETEAFALIRSLVGHDRSVIMVVDIGAVTTDVSIIDGGIPTLNRSVNQGGKGVTDLFRELLGLMLEEAERVKIDLARAQRHGGAIADRLEPFFTPLLNELQYTMAFYQGDGGGSSRTTKRRIEKVIVTGGSAYLPELTQIIARRLGVPAYLGDPWARVTYPAPLKTVLAEIGPRFSVAVGLALRDFE